MPHNEKTGEIAAHAKDFSSFVFPTPLHITGRFSNPAIYLAYSALVEQTATAVVLALVGVRCAALVPFVETGTGENSACQVLLFESQEQQRLRQEQREGKSRR